MAALTSDYDALGKESLVETYQLKAGTQSAPNRIYQNALVCIDPASGGLVPGDDLDGYIFVGVAVEPGQDPENVYSETKRLRNKIRVYKTGSYVFTMVGAAATDKGKEVYLIDDQTVQTTAPVNAIKCGVIIDVPEAGKVRIRIDNYVK